MFINNSKNFLLTVALIASLGVTFLGLLNIYLKPDSEAFAPADTPENADLALMRLYEELPVKPTDIVFIGDSHVQLFDLPELLKRKDVINRGLFSDHSRGVYQRIDVILKYKPKKIFIEVGDNDILTNTPMDTSRKYLLGLIAKIQKTSPGTAIFVQSLFPSRLLPHDKIASYNRLLQKVSKQQHITYIDCFTPLQQQNLLAANYDCGDGLHLSGKGYVKLAGVLQSYL